MMVIKVRQSRAIWLTPDNLTNSVWDSLIS